MLTAGIVLAAGQSQRMGRSKIDLPLEGVPLGAYAVSAALASRLDVVIVVVRPEDTLHWLKDLSTEKLVVECCEEYQQGMSHSLRQGVRAARDRKADCAVILLADQPLVQTEHVNRLLTVYTSSSELHYVSSRDGILDKPPLLLSREMFSLISKLKGDEGARAIIRDPSFPGESIMLDSEIFYDADTPEAFDKIKKHMQI